MLRDRIDSGRAAKKGGGAIFSHNIRAGGPIQGVEGLEGGLMSSSFKVFPVASQIVVGTIAARDQFTEPTLYDEPALELRSTDSPGQTSVPPPPPGAGSGGNHEDGGAIRFYGLGQRPSLAGTTDEIKQKMFAMEGSDELITTIAADTALLSVVADRAEGAAGQIEYSGAVLTALEEALKERGFDHSEFIGIVHFMAKEMEGITEYSVVPDWREFTGANPNVALLPLARATAFIERQILHSSPLSPDIAQKIAEIYAVTTLSGLTFDTAIEFDNESECFPALAAITSLHMMNAARRFANLGMDDEARSVANAFSAFRAFYGIPSDGVRWSLDTLADFIRTRAREAAAPGIDEGERRARTNHLFYFIDLMRQGNYIFSPSIVKMASGILDEEGFHEKARDLSRALAYERDFAAKADLHQTN